METPKTGTIGLTISPKPQKCNANRDLFLLWTQRLHKTLKTFCKEYMIYHEFDKTGRLHFHGTILPYDMIKFKRCNGKLRELGFCKFEMKFKNYTKWIEYCSKDKGETLAIYNNVPSHWLPITHSNYKQINNELKLEHTNKTTTWFERNL